MHPTDLVIYALAIALTVAAYARDPGTPLVGLKSALGLLKDIGPRLLAALALTGMLQVLISPEQIQRFFGRSIGHRSIFLAFLAGILTLGDRW